MKEPLLSRQLELRFSPVQISVTCLVLMIGFGFVFPRAFIPLPMRGGFSTVLILGGIGLVLYSGYLFKRAGTTHHPRVPEEATSLVTDGPYRFSRNPMYLGIAAILTGVAIGISNIMALLVVAGFVAYLTRFQIEPEERILEARFGDEYRAFKAKVRRWL